MSINTGTETETGMEIAVIGMAGRFPGCGDIHEFWENLKNGAETITFLTDEELQEAGVSPDLIAHPDYVKAIGHLENIEYFDAAFFGYTPREAEMMDPQTRIFHECAWTALEDAGYDPWEYKGLIGLFAGATPNLNWEGRALVSGKMAEMGFFAARQLTQKDYLSLRVSYKLNLTGSSISLYTTCSTSLVAIHMAAQVLLNGECDMVLAGGVSATMPVKTGYVYQEGLVLSPDGHCRAFDAAAKGTNPAEGAGLVVLKTLEDALQDRDHIYAVIKGSAINNDGVRKAGFTAASIQGQAEVIKLALQAAEVEPESIGYIETHGTGTELGDPVEMEALKLAFNSRKRAFCAVGAVKANLGHLDAAAGVTGFIKTVLVLKHGLIPPSIYFEIPNPNIDFVNSPFYVNTKLCPWESNGLPRRAGVSSFGLGGTNVHVILEEVPEKPEPTEPTGPTGSGPIRHWLILLSARSSTALDQVKKNLAEYLLKNPGLDISDAAYTLQAGRKAFSHRWMAVGDTREQIMAALTAPEPAEPGEMTAMSVVASDRENPVPVKTGPVRDKDREAVLQVGHLWLQGHKIDWEDFYSLENIKPRRVSLPTYPFERQRYWIDMEDVNVSGEIPIKNRTRAIPDMADWFYLPTWKRSVREGNNNRNSRGKQGWLVFANRLNLAGRLVEELCRMEPEVVLVEISQEFEQPGERRFGIDPKKSEHYDTLFKKLELINRFPDKIVHLWGLSEDIPHVPEGEYFKEVQYLGFFSLLYMVKALGRQTSSHDIAVTVFTNHVQEVMGNEPLCPSKATVLGLLKSIPQEYPGLSCSTIDIQLPEPGTAEETQLITALLEELTLEPATGTGGPAGETTTAYRHNQRWVQIYSPLHLEEPEEQDLRFREQGVYLVTGGLGRIGQMFAQLLTNRGGTGTRLILTGRSAFPDREQWNQWQETHDASDPVSLKIKQLEKLEAMGAQVRYFQADATDRQRMKQVISECQESCGPINGIIHAAGILERDSMQTLQDLSDDDCWQLFQAKVFGTLILEEFFNDTHLDFCWMLSSISCVLGGLGFGAYASANVFMDVLVKQHNQLNPCRRRWFSLNWDGMDTAKSIAIFERMFPLRKVDQLVAANGGNLEERIAKWINLETVKEKKSGAAAQANLYPRPNVSAPYVEPRDSVEQAVFHVWQALLGFEKIGVHDDFLELGGDSLKAITVISKIHRELQVNVPVTEFFSNPTIAGIARYISAHEKRDIYLAIEPVEKKEFYPVSLAQRRLFTIQQMDKENISYNMAYVFTLEEKIHKNEIEQAFKKLINRHESLRTTFRFFNNEPIQVVHRDVDFKLTYYDLAAANAEPSGDIIKKFVRPHDLSRAPLFRAGLLHQGRDSHLLIVDMHHIISDGISLRIILQDFMMLYTGEELCCLPIQNKDYAQWQNQPPIKETIKKQEKFWLTQFLDNLPQLTLPTDFDAPGDRVYQADSIGFELDEQTTAVLKELGVAEGVTMFMVVLAIFDVLLWKISGQQDIVIGTGVDTRKDEAQQQILGMFINTLALRIVLQKDRTFKQFLQDVKKMTLSAYENQDYPFETLVEKVVPPSHRERNRNTLFDMFIMSQNMDTGILEVTETLESPGVNLKPHEYRNKAAVSIFDIGVMYKEVGNKLGFLIHYSTGLFKRETIEKLIGYLQEIAAAVTGDIDTRLRDIKVSHRLIAAETHITDDAREDFNF